MRYTCVHAHASYMHSPLEVCDKAAVTTAATHTFKDIVIMHTSCNLCTQGLRAGIASMLTAQARRAGEPGPGVGGVEGLDT